MAEVKSLFGGPTGEKQVNDNVVFVIEDLLQRAKAGEIIGITAAYIDEDGTAAYSFGGLTHGYGILGAMSRMVYEINRNNCEDA